jgi:hypothetical protein
VVAPDAKADKPAPKSISSAAADGTRRELLVAMRARVASAVEDARTPARDLAALTRRLMDIAQEIEAIEAREKQEAAEDANGHPDEAWDAEAL